MYGWVAFRAVRALPARRQSEPAEAERMATHRFGAIGQRFEERRGSDHEIKQEQIEGEPL